MNFIQLILRHLKAPPPYLGPPGLFWNPGIICDPLDYLGPPRFNWDPNVLIWTPWTDWEPRDLFGTPKTYLGPLEYLRHTGHFGIPRIFEIHGTFWDPLEYLRPTEAFKLSTNKQTSKYIVIML